MNKFKDLKVWQRAMGLSTEVYKCVALFPNTEKYGLVSQLTRCSVSIPSNISEGAGRNSEKEFAHFLSIALGSAFELETQLIIATRLSFLNEEKSNTLLTELDQVQKMINGLRRSLLNKL